MKPHMNCSMRFHPTFGGLIKKLEILCWIFLVISTMKKNVHIYLVALELQSQDKLLDYQTLGPPCISYMRTNWVHLQMDILVNR